MYKVIKKIGENVYQLSIVESIKGGWFFTVKDNDTQQIKKMKFFKGYVYHKETKTTAKNIIILGISLIWRNPKQISLSIEYLQKYHTLVINGEKEIYYK